MTPFLVGVTLVGVCYIAYVVEDLYEKSKLMALRIDSAEKRVDFCNKRLDIVFAIHESFRRRLDELEKSNIPLKSPSQKDEEKAERDTPVAEDRAIPVETNDTKSASDKVRSKIENIDLMNAFVGHEYETLEEIGKLASSRNMSVVVVKEDGKNVDTFFCLDNTSLAVSVILHDGKYCVDEFIGIIGCGN